MSIEVRLIAECVMFDCDAIETGSEEWDGSAWDYDGAHLLDALRAYAQEVVEYASDADWMVYIPSDVEEGHYERYGFLCPACKEAGYVMTEESATEGIVVEQFRYSWDDRYETTPEGVAEEVAWMLEKVGPRRAWRVMDDGKMEPVDAPHPDMFVTRKVANRERESAMP